MKALFTLLIGFLVVQQSFANVDVRDRLAIQEFVTSNYKFLHGKKEFQSIANFRKALAKKNYRQKSETLLNGLDSYMVDRHLMALLYWRSVEWNPRASSAVLFYHLLSRAAILRDVIEHPIYYSPAYKKLAEITFQKIFGLQFDSNQFFSGLKNKFWDSMQSLANIKDDKKFLQAFLQSPELTFSLSSEIDLGHPFVLTWPGFIPGNQVEIISFNETSPERIKWVNDRVMYNGASLNWEAPYMKMPDEKGENGHPVWHDPIFRRIREMVDRSKESIFIDIFLFGGTMGATLAKHLLDHIIEQKKVNPKFKALILHDYATNYSLGKEMLPIFTYLRDRIKTEPALADSVFLLQANFQRHPPGIPFAVTDLIQKTPEVHKVIEKMDTYYESKIDHSKVIVIDAESDSPEAYFGSKNWTDHSGSYYFDNAIYLKGPAAAVVQGLYYDDVEAALTLDPKEQAWFYHKDKGLDNGDYLSRRAEILDWFKIKRSSYPSYGQQIMRIAEANVDGKIKNVRGILVDMIRSAQKNIFMEQLFIYDKYVVDALIKVKKQKPWLDIRIIADHNGNFGMNGLPNSVFLRELESAGIKLRARKTVGFPLNFADGSVRVFHQENHRKATSVDGKAFLGGSSNINPDTLQGSFREFGAQIFDREQIAHFDREFEHAWSSEAETEALNTRAQLKLGKSLLSERFSAIINGIGAILIRSKDFIENRENPALNE